MDPVLYFGGQLALQRQADLLRDASPRRERKRRRLAFTLRRTRPIRVPCPSC